MAVITGDRFVVLLVKYLESEEGAGVLEGTKALKVNPVGLQYVHTRLDSLQEVESLRSGAPVDYLRAYISDLGDYRKLEQLRRALCLVSVLKVVSVLPFPSRDPTPVCLVAFSRLRFLELRNCNLSAAAATGLLQLRDTLEKIICYNSTDALRHIFAARIVDIKSCPVWTRLTFVSCCNNNMLLMDESLQLLPAVENLNLSQNRFAKISNLRNCTKLKHLDLAYNHIRSISSLRKVSRGIKTLILKNNALSTLRGIETLTALEGLDLSFNVLSSISEIELLANLPFLEKLWLEGNPISYAKLYREQVFSFFPHQHKLILDEDKMSKREAWTVSVLLSRRRKQRPGFGFYALAKDIAHPWETAPLDSCNEPGSSGNVSSKSKRRLCRVASIEDPEENRHVDEDVKNNGSSSPFSTKISSENYRGAGDSISNSDIFDKIELLKKENTTAWFQQLSDLLSSTAINTHNIENGTKQASQLNGTVNTSRITSDMSDWRTENHGKRPFENLDESGTSDKSQHASDCIQGNTSVAGCGLSGSSMLLEDSVDSISNHVVSMRKNLYTGTTKGKEVTMPGFQRSEVFNSTAEISNINLGKDEAFPAKNVSLGECTNPHNGLSELNTSPPIGSPPHYQENILHLRQNFEDEFVQVSLDSCSLGTSSDSETSYGESLLSSSSSLEYKENVNDLLDIEHSDGTTEQNQITESDLTAGVSSLNSVKKKGSNVLSSYQRKIRSHNVLKGITSVFKRTGKRKEKSRPVEVEEEKLAEERSLQSVDLSKSLSVSAGNGVAQIVCRDGMLNKLKKCSESTTISSSRIENLQASAKILDCNSNSLETSSHNILEAHLLTFFHNQVVDSMSYERCLCYVFCNCIRLWEDDPDEREVAVLLSSTRKLYIIGEDSVTNLRGHTYKVLGSHNLDDVKEILIGLGLQGLRVHIGYAASYLFITRSVFKSRDLIRMLENCLVNKLTESTGSELQSWELVQLELFCKHIIRCPRTGISFYAMLQFEKEGRWFARSLFLTSTSLFVCVEDIVQFGSVSNATVVSEPYFVPDHFASIENILELVIESEQEGIFLLVVGGNHTKAMISSPKAVSKKGNAHSCGNSEWRLKGFEMDTLSKFVDLLRALYKTITSQSLLVKSLPTF